MDWISFAKINMFWRFANPENNANLFYSSAAAKPIFELFLTFLQRFWGQTFGVIPRSICSKNLPIIHKSCKNFGLVDLEFGECIKNSWSLLAMNEKTVSKWSKYPGRNTKMSDICSIKLEPLKSEISLMKMKPSFGNEKNIMPCRNHNKPSYFSISHFFHP